MKTQKTKPTAEKTSSSLMTTKSIVPNAIEHLSEAEQQQLELCEEAIKSAARQWHDAGKMLRKINTDRLYRAHYKTFDDYCESRWGMDRSYAYRMMKAATVIDNLLPIGNTLIPFCESQVRPLVRLPVGEQQKIWKHATASGHVPTAKEIQEIVSANYPKKPAHGHRNESGAETDKGKAGADRTKEKPTIDITAIVIPVPGNTGTPGTPQEEKSKAASSNQPASDDLNPAKDPKHAQADDRGSDPQQEADNSDERTTELVVPPTPVDEAAPASGCGQQNTTESKVNPATAVVVGATTESPAKTYEAEVNTCVAPSQLETGSETPVFDTAAKKGRRYQYVDVRLGADVDQKKLSRLNGITEANSCMLVRLNGMSPASTVRTLRDHFSLVGVFGLLPATPSTNGSMMQSIDTVLMFLKGHSKRADEFNPVTFPYDGSDGNHQILRHVSEVLGKDAPKKLLLLKEETLNAFLTEVK